MSDTGKKATPEQNTRVQLIRVIGQTLWKMNIDPEDGEMTADSRKENWKEHKTAYLQAARSVVRRLEKKGFQITRPSQ